MVLSFLVSASLLLAVPPHPKKTSGILNISSRPSDNFGPRSKNRRPVPQHVLVLLSQFSDVQFQSESAYPDFHPHNVAYFDKYMTHLKDYYADASRDQFKLNYTIHPEIVTLNKTMGYYGDDSIDGERRAEMARDVILALDNQINYHDYDAFILFHAGGGQESDIYDTQQNAIWSTFLTKPDFRDAFDADNMDYQGIATNDGTFISEMVIVPESQRHPDFPVMESPYLDDYVYDIFGVLAHQFGHQLGLPTLFDNYSANGSSAGIGNFGLMGTAVWNNNGKTPCLPSAWSRYYMGWEYPVTITSNSDSLKITYPMNKANGTPRIYKIPITEDEFFLIENRQANFRKDNIEINGGVNDHLFTFDVLPDSLQDFYPETSVPMPNMMENTLRGCEWDYFLPYVDATTGSWQDPSGLLIWHIDRVKIYSAFSDDFEMNRPNGDALHKGVDLEEADGIQHMDSSRPDYYMRGGPFDSYREGNKTYFGKSVNPFTGQFSNPTSESYYGNTQIEIYNISASKDTMTFSVRFNQQIHFPDAHAVYNGHDGEFIFAEDFNQNDLTELYFFNIDGNILSDEQGNQSSYDYNNITDNCFYRTYAYDTVDKKIYIPFNIGENAVISFDGSNIELIGQAQETQDHHFFGPLITIPDTISYNGKRVFLAGLGQRVVTNCSGSEFIAWMKDDTGQISKFELQKFYYRPVTNMCYQDGIISYIVRNLESNYLIQVNLNNMTHTMIEISHSENMEYAYLLQADFNNDGIDEFSFTYKTYRGTFAACIMKADGSLLSGFPVEHKARYICAPTLADLDNNGSIDLIVGSSTGYHAIAYNGALINPHFEVINPDSSGYGEGLITLQKDNKTYIMGIIGNQRLCLWDHTGKMMPGYPVVYRNARKSPFIYVKGDSVFAYIGTCDGDVYKHHLSMFTPSDIQNSNFLYGYGNLNRTASWRKAQPQNMISAEALFIKGQNYVYPNPWLNLYENKIIVRTMLSKTTNAKVSIYDIAGNLVWQKTDLCTAYIPNVTSFVLDSKKLATGVYYAIIEANNKLHRLKFAVEK